MSTVPVPSVVMGEVNARRTMRSLRWMSIGFLLFALIFTLYLFSTLFMKASPTISGWRGIVVFCLSIIFLALYAQRVFRLRNDRVWPPALRYALSVSVPMYLCVVVLSWIDTSFIWYFYTVFGVCFSLFSSRRLLLAVSTIVITFYAFQGLFAWPFSSDQIGVLIGETITFFALTISPMLIQRLLSERYAREKLLHNLAQTNTELEEAHRQLADSVLKEQELAVLRERTRLAREMHDTLGHALVLVSVKLEIVQRLRQQDPGRFEHELEATKEIVRNSMKELRASIANLRSPALEHEPACRALSRYAREMALRGGMHIDYDIQSDCEGLPEQVDDTLWRVGQEALTNIEKHSHAYNIVLSMKRQNGRVIMKVEDDGVGLAQELYTCERNGKSACTGPEGHYGLRGMAERVKSLDGTIYLCPGKPQGTIVEVELPLVESPLP